MNDSKTIFRVIKDRENPYAQIDRRVLENPTLSWKAKGLLGYLLSRPDNWTICMGDLINRSTDGEHATRSAVKELREAGHIKLVREVDANNRVTRWVMEVYEQPIRPDAAGPESGFPEVDIPQGGYPDSGFPDVDFPQLDSPHVENRALNKKDLNDTESNETKKYMGAEAPARRSDANKQGDAMDGILFFTAQASDPTTALNAKIAVYPGDVQATIKHLAEIYCWPPGAIPARPKSSKGGDYALWIREVREINQVITGFGREALEATKAVCANLSISHPGAISWCLAGEVGKLSRKKAASVSATPFAQHLSTFQPRS